MFQRRPPNGEKNRTRGPLQLWQGKFPIEKTSLPSIRSRIFHALSLLDCLASMFWGNVLYISFLFIIYILAFIDCMKGNQESLISLHTVFSFSIKI